MNKNLVLYTLLIAGLSPSSLLAQDANEQCYRKLCQYLQEQTQVLARVSDLATAAAALPSYQDCAQKLLALQQLVKSENDFVQFVEKDAQRQRQVNILLFGLSRELQRLHAVQCYGMEDLSRLLFATPPVGATPAVGN